MPKTKARKIEEIIGVQERGEELYLLYTAYPESDAINASGQILQHGWERGAPYEGVLNVNDSLATLWISPSGSIWSGSGRGNIYTTAKVRMAPHRIEGLDLEHAEGFDWAITTLPDMQGRGYRPNITALWGTDDTNVFAGTFKGGMYQWDGREWRQQTFDVSSSINRIHGRTRSDVYAVGADGTILHFDGSAWSRLPYPADDSAGVTLTGVEVLENGEALVVGTDGRILRGNRSGFEIVAGHPYSFYGVGTFRRRIFTGLGDDGIGELTGKNIEVIKPNIAAVGVYPTTRKVFFVEATQAPASLVEFDPDLTQPWWRRTF